MADLDKLLLGTAGKMATTGRNLRSSPPHRRRLKVTYSDDGSDPKNDGSDDDHAYSSRKPSGLQVPLKKSLAPTKRDDDHSIQEEGDNDDDYDHECDSDYDSVGNDLYKDENDREKLSKLTELEREMILEGRATKRSDRDLTENLKKRKGQDIKGNPPKAHIRLPHSKAERAGALAELVKRRRNAASRGSGSRCSPVKKRALTAATFSNTSWSDEGELQGDGGMMADSDEDNMSSESQVPTFEDIKEITIGRSKLVKWYMEPFFNELIAGCFVRVGIGKAMCGRPIYRLCTVRNVDATNPHRPYRFDNKTTRKYLNLVWGNESSAARWQMAVISDAPPVKEEFDQLVKEVEKNGGLMPTKQEVLEKMEAIKKTDSFVYTAATVKQMLEEKKSAASRPLNIAAEKARLRAELEMVKDDEAEVDRIKERLQELEAAGQTRKKIENLKNASELKPVRTSLKAGEPGYDPFSRRWTRSRNYFTSNSSGAAAGRTEAKGDATAALADSNVGGRVSAESGVAATAAALEAAAGEGKLLDTSAPLDQGTEPNMLHGFELSISLAGLQKFGGPQGARAGFMAKKQRTEATVGRKVPEDDVGSHAHTLTVDDYKKRRGLI
ncbi:hypothetical protein Pfo_023317 [Paulownia fortunei]|nr:hypothetical protein Pfo_023317 [Paulownia fortunei]